MISAASGQSSTAANGGTTLAVNASSFTFGDVRVDSTATGTITLTASGASSVNVQSAMVSGAGFSIAGGALPAVLTPGQSLNLSIQFEPTLAGAASGLLTLSSTAATSVSVVTMSGDGVPPEVQLSWADGSVEDPAASFNVYRTVSGGSQFQLLGGNSTGIAAYADATVAIGTSYDYYVTSVDADGNESAPSDTVTVEVQ